MFEEGTREDLRKIFEPSRLVLVSVRSDKTDESTFFPVAFNMYCGYKPLEMAIAVHNINFSYSLLKEAKDFVICIPGEHLAQICLESGMTHGNSTDKFIHFDLHKLNVEKFSSFGIRECKANLFCRKVVFNEVGDHAIVVGEVELILIDDENMERNIVTTSPYFSNLEILAAEGIHRLAVLPRKENNSDVK